MQDRGFWKQVTGCWMQVTGFKLLDTYLEVEGMRYKLEHTNLKLHYACIW